MFGPKIEVGVYILEKDMQKVGISLTTFDQVIGAQTQQSLIQIKSLTVPFLELIIS